MQKKNGAIKWFCKVELPEQRHTSYMKTKGLTVIQKELLICDWSNKSLRKESSGTDSQPLRLLLVSLATLGQFGFNPLEFEGVRNQAGANAFTMSPKKWIEATNAIGIASKSGRHGGTFAHSDIAFEFASWILPEFKLYIIKEFQRIKQSEAYNNAIEWNVRRELAKANYVLQTDTIKDCLILPELTKGQINHIYASEADLLNVALFGQTAS